jgi:hypothetical protein
MGDTERMLTDEPPNAPLFDHELEGNVLGWLTSEPGAHEEIYDWLHSYHFNHHPHRVIFSEIEAMREAGEPIDPFTLRARLQESGKMGYGPEFEVDQLEYGLRMTRAEYVGHLPAHVALIIKYWRKRRYMELAGRLAAAAQEGRDDLIPAFVKRLEEVQREGDNDEATEARAKRESFKFLTDNECERIPPVRGLVGNILHEDAIAFLYAREGRWKTFLALDMGLSLATPTVTSWHGRPVGNGPVVYICAEGARGIGKRIRAWKRYHGITDSVPIHVLPTPVQLLDHSQVRELIARIQAQFDSPVLVVIDTLARSMAGGNENDTKDINAVTDAAYLIRAAFGCCVLILHHSGKDGERGMRGSSAIRSNADIVMRLVSANEQEPLIKPGEPVTLKSEKPKDFDPFEDICLTTQLVTWATEAGEFLSSLVIVPGDLAAVAARHVTLTDAQQTALDTLYQAPAGMRAMAWLRATRLADRTFYEARDALVEARGYVALNVHEDDRTKFYTVTEAGREHVTAELRKDCDRTAEADGRTAEGVEDDQDGNPGFMGTQPTADTAEPIGVPQFRSSGAMLAGRECYVCKAWLPALPEGGYTPCAQCSAVREEVR